MEEQGDKRLFCDFEKITTQLWEEKIKADLRGADYQKKLIWNTDEGIAVKPYYRDEDLESLEYLTNLGKLKKDVGTPNGWIICQHVVVGKNLIETNSRIKEALKGGVQAISIQMNNVFTLDLEQLKALLDGIPLGDTELIFLGYMGADALYGHLYELAKQKGVDPAKLKGSLGADPLGKMARSGIAIASLENLGNLIRKVKENSPEMRVINVDGAMIQNAGSTLSQELAFAMAMASDYMSLLISQGIEPEGVQNTMQLNLSVGPNYFMEVAKLRAARILWAKISEAYGTETSNARIQIHSISSEWNMTLYDPYVNMVRGTTEAMSSILGGSDMVSVLPFDYPNGSGNEFSDRIARNVQIILREEAYFDRVADPAAGSYYIENLTDSIGEKSWDIFGEVESRGGFQKAFEAGWIQEQVMASFEKKKKRTASGKEKILGTNAYPNFNEFILENINYTVDSKPVDSVDSPIQPLKPFRLSSMYEDLRLETERSITRPKVLLFKFGNPAWMTARAAFSGNFFACAGYEIIDHPPFATIEEGIQYANDEKVDIAVLCSSDDAYPEIAPKVHNAVKSKSIVVVAGYPADSVETLQQAGIKHFIHVKSNLLETLKSFNKILLK